MRIEIDVTELDGDEDWGRPIGEVLRSAIRDETEKWVRKMVKVELDKVAEPVRKAIGARTEVLLQAALDEVREMPETTIMDALLYDRAERPHP